MKSFMAFINENGVIQTNRTADAKERAAFETLSKALMPLGATAFVKPMGFDAGFPDFGFQYVIDRKRYDIHVEYKMDSKAQMGSMRDWKYDGKKFLTPDASSTSKEELIFIMNNDQTAINNANRLLKSFKEVFGNKITEISSGMLSQFKNMEERRLKLQEFARVTNNYTISKIENSSLGDKIIKHYVNKFEAKKRAGTTDSVLLMMIGSELYFVSGKIPPQLEETLGGEIPNIGDLKAKLEVRIQPRGLNTPGKAVRIDAMASFRLAGGISRGLRVR
jgi:hypothetical protein